MKHGYLIIAVLLFCILMKRNFKNIKRFLPKDEGIFFNLCMFYVSKVHLFGIFVLFFQEF